MILDAKDIYPIFKMDQNCVLGNNGDISFLFSVNLPEKYSMGEHDFDQIHLEKLRFYSMLPKNCVVHNQHIYLKKNFLGFSGNKTYFERISNQYFYGREYMLHLPFMYITLTNFKSLKRSYLNSGLFKRGVVKEDLNRLSEFSKAVDRAVTYFNNSSYMDLEPLSEDVVKNVILNYITGFNGQKLTDIEFKPKFRIGDNF